MAPKRRTPAFPRVVIERDTDSEESSSSSEEDEVEEAFEEVEEEVEGEDVKGKEETLVPKKKNAAPITISLKKVCKVRPFLCCLKLTIVTFLKFMSRLSQLVDKVWFFFFFFVCF